MIEEPVSLTIILQQLLVDFLTLLPKLIAALVVFAVGLYLASIIRRLVRRGLERRTKNPQPIALLSQLAYWLSVILVTAISLQMIGFNLTAFLAGLGVVGITIGFALQDVSKNFIAGVLMLIQQPFEIGEFIEVSGYTGKVLAIDLRATQIRTEDGKLVLIPNGEVMISPITNYSQAEARRVAISTGVAYESDPESVRQTALEAIAGVPGIQGEPAPDVLFENFGSPTLDLTIYFWIDTSQTNVASAKDAGLKAIKSAFDQAQINMPLPAQTVYLVQ
ncbi:MAG: mechanosensitive ion channel [Anaerolineales bacterium]